MPRTRSYKLLCPIARALDRIGDRWTLLILRDLHAAPARFSDLQNGLNGIAANLLTERLVKLTSDGLILKDGSRPGTTVYALTERGSETADIIYSLARFGAQFEPEGEVVRPGNLRTVATTLGLAARHITPVEADFTAMLMVDDEPISIVNTGGAITVEYSDLALPDFVLETSYEALLDVTEGALSAEEFATDHSKLTVNSPGREHEFLAFMGAIVAEFQRGASSR